jgi:hypothetical protein
MSQRSLHLITAMLDAAKAAHPITGRGIGYKLFSGKFIASMAVKDMRAVYRLLKLAREEGMMPWGWIVDETRAMERAAVWSDAAEYARVVAQSYRRDF